MPTEPDASQVARDRKLLDRLGYGVLDVQSGSGVGFEDVHRYTYLVEPELSPRATARRLRSLLGRPFSEREARAAWEEIGQYRAEQARETGTELPIEQAAKEWDEQYGLAFRRRWSLTAPEVGEHTYMPGARERGPSAVGRATGLAVPDLRPLLESGFSVSDVLVEAAKRPGRTLRLALTRVPKRKRAEYYIRLVADLTGWTLSREEAEQVWGEVLKHKLELSERLGHDVPLERAVVDYFKRLRLAGLDRAALWETGQRFGPSEPET